MPVSSARVGALPLIAFALSAPASSGLSDAVFSDRLLRQVKDELFLSLRKLSVRYSRNMSQLAEIESAAESSSLHERLDQQSVALGAEYAGKLRMLDCADLRREQRREQYRPGTRD